MCIRDRYEERPIKEEHPSQEELREWYKKSGLPLKKFFNTSGNIYKEMSLKDKLPQMDEEQQLALLATDGMLVKRPLVIADGFVLTGFKEAEWKEKLSLIHILVGTLEDIGVLTRSYHYCLPAKERQDECASA